VLGERTVPNAVSRIDRGEEVPGNAEAIGIYLWTSRHDLAVRRIAHRSPTPSMGLAHSLARINVDLSQNSLFGGSS